MRVEREKRKDMGVGVIFLEQLYPWPEAELQAPLFTLVGEGAQPVVDAA